MIITSNHFKLIFYFTGFSPPSPLPSHNGFPDGNFGIPFDGMGSLDSRSTARRLKVKIVLKLYFILLFIILSVWTVLEMMNIV